MTPLASAIPSRRAVVFRLRTRRLFCLAQSARAPRLEKLGQARAIVARNDREHPESQEAATTYAWRQFLAGNTRDADAIFQPMLEKGELTATVAYCLAEIANVRGNDDLAQNLLALALSQNANFPKRVAALELRELVEKQIQGPVKSDFDEPDFEEVEPEEC